MFILYFRAGDKRQEELENKLGLDRCSLWLIFAKQIFFFCLSNEQVQKNQLVYFASYSFVDHYFNFHTDPYTKMIS
jgi:hypothetical protein